MIKEKINKIISSPDEALRLLSALIRGYIIKFYFRLFKRNIKIGSSFRAYSWLYIKGPGMVQIGNKVSIEMSFLRYPTILTHSPDSKVIIGNGCYFGGTRISCLGRVTIGNEGLFGSSTIIDTEVIPHKSYQNTLPGKKIIPKPVIIGDYFWSGTNSFILGGSIIGEECVLGAGSVILDKEVTDRSLLVGNPARKIGSTREV